MVHEPYPFRWRTRLRRHLPWFFIALGVANKGDDCERHGALTSGTTQTTRRAVLPLPDPEAWSVVEV